MRAMMKRIWRQVRPALPRSTKEIWRDDRTLVVGDLTFTLVTWDFDKFTSSGKNFVLLKNRSFVEEYTELLKGRPLDRVLEFGIYHGANLLLMERYFGAGKVVGIDLRP